MTSLTPRPRSGKGKHILGISLKMYLSPSQTSTYVSSLATLAPLALKHNIELFILPSFLCIPSTSSHLTLHPPTILLGAQNCTWSDAGAFTGEISPSHLKELGCSLVELAHAERFAHFGETVENVVKKAEAVVRNEMIPLVCIGEKERGGVGEAVEECRVLVERVLDATSDDDGEGQGEKEVWFAYEPVWAIGQAEPAPKEHVLGVVKGIRRVCERRGKSVKVLYGGSAGPGTWSGIGRGGDDDGEGVDGLFLGRFAHDVGNVRRIIEEIGGK